MKTILGVICVSLPFIAIIGWSVCAMGITETVKCFAVVGVIIALIVIGCRLLV